MLSLCAKLFSLIPEIINIVNILSIQLERHEIRKRKKKSVQEKAKQEREKR